MRSTPRLSLRGATASGRLPLRVALVSVHGDPLVPIGAEEAGGQNVYVREVARALAERGHHVDVFTRSREADVLEVEPLGRARVIRLPTGPRGFVSRNHLYPHLAEFASRMERYTAESGQRYDVLHSNYWLSGWVGMRLTGAWRIPQLHTHHSLGAVKFAATGKTPAHGRVRLEVEDALSAHCDAIVATSPQDVASLRRHYVHQPRTAIVPCGVDDALLGPLDPAACRAELGFPDDRAVLLYVGRFDPNKGIETFVRAAALLGPEFPVQLVFAGGFDPATPDAREFERIRALVGELGLAAHATFLGKVAPEALAAVYSAADLCVVPSHYESFGLVSIEAMGCGTPVVASDVGGLRYSVVHRETGLLAPAQDEQAFAGSIRLLLADEPLRARMGRAGARLVQRMFTWRAVAERLEALYDGLAADRRPRRVGNGA